jgi:hypothetical protein
MEKAGPASKTDGTLMEPSMSGTGIHSTGGQKKQ